MTFSPSPIQIISIPSVLITISGAKVGNKPPAKVGILNFFVISNSSFAWWAAWLSQQNDKVITAPEKWSGLASQELIDIIPSSWIKIKF